MATRFPLDYDALQKGQVIPAELLEKMVGFPRDTEKYQLRLMAVQSQVMDEMKARGKPVTVVVRNRELVILTDPEASAYNHERLGSHLHGALRAHERSEAVDVGNLSEDQQAQHERRLEIGGKFTQAIVATAGKLRLKGYTRSVPGLPDGGEAG